MREPNIATRRTFLTQGLGLVGVGAALPNFLIRTALAGPNSDSNGRILVLLEMGGGHDGPSALVPYGMDGYYKLRKTIAVPKNVVIKLDDQLGLHPSLKGFRDLLDQRRFAVVPGVGYPNPNYSHFEAMDIYHVADLRGKKATFGSNGQEARGLGWIGRYCDGTFKNEGDPKRSLSIGGGVAPIALTGRRHFGIAFYQPDHFRYIGDRGDPSRRVVYDQLNEMPAGNHCIGADQEYITQTTIVANRSSAQLREIAGKYKTGTSYPDSELARSLRTVAGLIAGRLSTRIYFVRQGGYDTHSQQKPQHDRLMADLSDSVCAFYKDLTARANAGRVLTVTFSEFGRRPEENASQGTDHGSAGPMFLFGPGVKPGVHGTHPSYDKFNEHANFVHTTDFRCVYAAILEKWLGTASRPILGESFRPVDCIA